MVDIRVIIHGFGNVGQLLARCFRQQRAEMARFGLHLLVVGVADSRGFCRKDEGVDLDALLAAKDAGKSVTSVAGGSETGSILDAVEFDLCYEAGPTDCTSRAALDFSLRVLQMGRHIVFTCKGQLALGYRELQAAAKKHKACIRFSSCVGGALPTVNIGRRDLRGSTVCKIEAVLNLCTNKILKMMEAGSTLEEAKTYLSSKGLLETDPSNDLDGWDSVVKLLILGQSVLDVDVRVADIERVGIANVTASDIVTADSRLVLLCLAERQGNDGPWKFSVRPTHLPKTHPLAKIEADEMAILYSTAISGDIFASSRQVDAYPTCAAMIRDTIDIYCAVDEQ